MSPTSVPRTSSNVGAPSRRFGAGRIIAIVLGALFALTGLASLVGAGVLGWANATQRDAQGYFSTSTQRFSSSAYAITSDRLDLSSEAAPSEWFAKNDNVANVRIRAKASSTVFLGIGSQADVDRYLAGVAHDEITKVDYRPFSVDYRRSEESRQPKTPASEAFWVAKVAGAGTQTLTWSPKQGAWAVVVMNPAATPGVNADVALGVRVSFLGWIIGALIAGGVVALSIGVLLLIVGLQRSGRSDVYPAPSEAIESAGARIEPQNLDPMPLSFAKPSTTLISPLFERPSNLDGRTHSAD